MYLAPTGAGLLLYVAVGAALLIGAGVTFLMSKFRNKD